MPLPKIIIAIRWKEASINSSFHIWKTNIVLAKSHSSSVSGEFPYR